MAEGKAGSMGAGVAWLIAIGAALLVGGLGFAISSSGLTWLLSLAIYGAAGWAAVYMTKSGTGMAIVAFLVAGIVSGILTYFALKAAVSAASGALTSTMGEMAKAGGGSNNAQLNAQLAQAGDAMASGFGAMVGVIGFVVALLRCFIIGMIGCIVGGSMKKSALGGAQAKAA
jgi:hypothetical protein